MRGKWVEYGKPEAGWKAELPARTWGSQREL